MKIFITLLCHLLVASNVNAIDKNLHPGITVKALAQFRTCAAELQLRNFTSKQSDRIAKYTGKEDDPTLDRITNWHFYDHYRNTEYAMPESKSLHRIFKHRIEQLADAIKYDAARDYFANAGRIIHYLQDMGIPAHVAPNFHAKPNNWFEDLFYFEEHQPDPVDGMMVNIEYPAKQGSCQKLYQLNQAARERFSRSPGFYFQLFNDLLVTLAEDTRKTAQKTHFDNSDKSFETEFWNLRNPNEIKNSDPKLKYGFAAYAHNDHTRFNASYSPCRKNKANQDTCDRFVEKQYIKIINTTIRALMYLSDFRQPTQ